METDAYDVAVLWPVSKRQPSARMIQRLKRQAHDADDAGPCV